MASNELVLFLDDDCIFMSKDAVAAAVYSFKETERGKRHRTVASQCGGVSAVIDRDGR